MPRRAPTNGSSNTSVDGKRPAVDPGQRPDDVDDAVPRLIVELRRRAAELHGGEDVDLDLAAGILLDHLRPRRQHLGVAVGDGRQEVMQLQRHLRLSERRAGDGRRGERGACGSEKPAARDGHRLSSPAIAFGSTWPWTAAPIASSPRLAFQRPRLLPHAIVWHAKTFPRVAKC